MNQTGKSSRDDACVANAANPEGLALLTRAAELLAERGLKTQAEPVAASPEVLALTQAIHRGDEAAFARFYDLYSFRLYKFLLVLARGDENEAREVCQAVMIKLARRFDVFDEERRLWAWLCTLAKNAFIDHRRACRRLGRLITLEELPPTLEASRDTLPRLSELLRDALAGLAPGERELLQAAYVDERPLLELAATSGQTYKAVESRLARLRHKLKHQLLKSLRHESEF